ncbi:MAG: trimeric intracellular cation channel family protein [Pirellulales bacterium]|nr:trimeric intracellular cation channel family protein [Pirellulales bacterium]
MPIDQLIELLAVLSSGTYGVLLARRHHLDFVGVFSVALMVAFGGGTLRDLFLGRYPLFWIERSHYPIILFGLAIVTSLVPPIPDRIRKSLDVPDALGLGLFSVSGADAAIDSGTTLFIASLMGVITGTFGGVIGDVICNQVPNLFRATPLYATCSFVGCWIWFGLTALGVAEVIAVTITILLVVAVRLAAIRWNWRLPAPYDSNPDPDDRSAA